MINNYIGSHQKNQKGLKTNLITFNPYTSHLYFKISYFYIKTFINFYKDNSDLLKHIDNNEENHHVDAHGGNGDDDDEEEEEEKNN